MENNADKEQQDRNLEELNYPASEDIFNQQELVSLDADGNPMEQEATDLMDMDLDVPGSELDNEQQAVGSEDEENNYYSLDDQNNEASQQAETL